MPNYESIPLIFKTLQAYPVIWFDNVSLGLFLNKDRKVISRAIDFLEKMNFIERHGRYFKLFTVNEN